MLFMLFPEGVKPPGPFCSAASLHCISWKALASVYGAHPCSVTFARTCPELSMTTSPVQDTFLISDALLLEITTQ